MQPARNTILGTLHSMRITSSAPVRADDAHPPQSPAQAAAHTPQVPAPLSLPPPVPFAAQQSPLPLSAGRVFGSYDAWEPAQVASIYAELNSLSCPDCGQEFAEAAVKLAELGWHGSAADALYERLLKYPDDDACLGGLGKVKLLAGLPDAAIAAADEGRVHGLHPVAWANIVAKAHLLKNEHALAAKVLRSHRQHSSLVMSMIEHSLKRKYHRHAPRWDPMCAAYEMSHYWAWHGHAGVCVRWLELAIGRGEYQEVARFIRSPFIAPIRNDLKLQEIIGSLGLEPQELVAWRTDARPPLSPVLMLQDAIMHVERRDRLVANLGEQG